VKPRLQALAERFDLGAAVGFLIYKAHQRSFAEFRRLLEPLRLTPAQFGVLALLYQRDGQRQATLCERAAVDPNTMVGIIDRLEAAGRVNRDRDPRDRRAYLVRITAEGRHTFERCLPRQRQATERCWSRLSPAELDALRNLLRKALHTWQPRYGDEVHEHG
jgi:DNA-binding MarR family transcriptional regulator